MANESVPVKDTPAVKEKAPRGPRGRVVIFGMWCKGCGLCVEFCPTGVLGFTQDGVPVVLHPEKCTACHWCDTHCPDLAIVVHRIGEEGA
jgi:2-oxoglutarate ferredoxin oxidoreductase subunit delta